MDLYASMIRPLLFRLSADRAHDLARLALRVPAVWPMVGAAQRRAAGTDEQRLATDLAGIPLRSPIGLAPGFDKDGDLVAGLRELGFGYLVVGSITTRPRPGNPKPRLVRYPDELSIGNSMGLPSKGLAGAVRRLQSLRSPGCPVIASLAGATAGELLQAVEAVQPHVAGVEIGLVCPNTTESERLRELEIFTELAEGLASLRRKPVFIKLPPHHDAAERQRVLEMLDVCLRVGLDGVSVSGTRQLVQPGLAMGRGSLAGRPVFADSVRMVGEVADHAGGRLAIKASGGVFTGEDAAAMLRAGATTVEVYSSFVYRGWSIARSIGRELVALMEREGLRQVGDLSPSTAA
jgi:dihydroorotate dehydrogenase